MRFHRIHVSHDTVISQDLRCKENTDCGTHISHSIYIIVLSCDNMADTIIVRCFLTQSYSQNIRRSLLEPRVMFVSSSTCMPRAAMLSFNLSLDQTRARLILHACCVRRIQRVKNSSCEIWSVQEGSDARRPRPPCTTWARKARGQQRVDRRTRLCRYIATNLDMEGTLDRRSVGDRANRKLRMRCAFRARPAYLSVRHHRRRKPTLARNKLAGAHSTPQGVSSRPCLTLLLHATTSLLRLFSSTNLSSYTTIFPLSAHTSRRPFSQLPAIVHLLHHPVLSVRCPVLTLLSFPRIYVLYLIFRTSNLPLWPPHSFRQPIHSFNWQIFSLLIHPRFLRLRHFKSGAVRLTKQSAESSPNRKPVQPPRETAIDLLDSPST